MKAENILNSNLTLKNTICFEIFCKKRIFQNFRVNFDGIFFSKREFFKNFHILPPNSLILNTKKGIYMKV